MDTIFQNALTFFLVVNPIGNSPAILALVKEFDFKSQKRIILREGFFALIVAFFFQYLGEHFLSMLHIKNYAVTLCGGIVLFLVALQMIFAIATPEKESTSSLKTEPFIVPIATPLLSGPGLLTIIVLKSQLIQNHMLISLAILIAWIGVMAVMIAAPYLQKVLGKRGLVALEQLMGLLLAMMSMQMIVKGVNLFLDQIK